ncbi:MAG TPA: HoxN/HupN/NixA family nickel/cobalt transporter [Candidatus Dormibacteraeota bacterium]|nr:HoxN/HupN/NixA family nickel/cobalt transporter [Candidatus Dormibacteraeota bacterium]
MDSAAQLNDERAHTLPSVSLRRRAAESTVTQRLVGVFSAVGLLHILGWGGLLFLVGPRYPALAGAGILAYTLGLRHAFDADHIAAIDNTTRKLLQQGQKPMGVGFFFSLGHSTVVFVMAIALGLAAQFVTQNINSFKSVGGVIGTSVSGVFLYVIGIINLVALIGIIHVFRNLRRGRYDAAGLDEQLITGGIIFPFLRPLFRFITRSWQMYPMGVMFGLGFDTATEVALLALAGGFAAKGLPIWAILPLPILFAAGMSVMDTADGAFMAKAYNWAFSNPIRKVFYNLTVTGLSVGVALFIGTVELLQVISGQLGWSGGFWNFLNSFDLNKIGFGVVTIFVVVWAVALIYWKVSHVEERWGELLKS